MTWEQKLQALQALAGSFSVSLRMRHPGNWYVQTQGVEVSDGHILGSPTEAGGTPEDAVDKHWASLTVLKPGEWLVLGAGGDSRRYVKWNGFMWENYNP